MFLTYFDHTGLWDVTMELATRQKQDTGGLIHQETIFDVATSFYTSTMLLALIERFKFCDDRQKSISLAQALVVREISCRDEAVEGGDVIVLENTE